MAPVGVAVAVDDALGDPVAAGDPVAPADPEGLPPAARFAMP